MSDKTTTASTSIAQQVFESEIQAIRVAMCYLDEHFDKAVELVLGCDSHIVVSGLGKSGLVGQKISATLASTGTPSHFLHPTEAVHGDLGRIRRGDVVILMSYSGRTEEVASLAAILRQDDVPIISISRDRSTRLAELSEAALSTGNIEEACQHGLAPTSTTTAMMAIGDALAVAVSRQRNFSAEDFGKSHPGGTLGRTMMPISEMLRFKVGKNITIGKQDQTVQEILSESDQHPRRCGAMLISNEQGKLVGLLTDGDLRRLLLKHGADILSKTVGEVMTKDPTCVVATAAVQEAIQVIREKRIDELPVIDAEGHPVGVIDVQDLLALKLIEDD